MHVKGRGGFREYSKSLVFTRYCSIYICKPL
jgi:hypothetical protein